MVQRFLLLSGFTAFVFFMAPFFLTITVFAQDAGLDSPADQKPAKEVSVDPTADDEDIATRLSRIMRATQWFENVRVTTQEGIVFLQGTTTTQSHKDWAERLARNTQDVVAVVNRVEVLPEPKLDFSPAASELVRMWRLFVQLLPLIAVGLVIMTVAWLLAKLVARITRPVFARRSGSALLGRLGSQLVALPVIILGLYLVLQTLGLTRLALTIVGGTGVVGIVAGFAFRDIAENFLASVLLSLRRPFLLNDYIQVSGFEGIVRSMNTRSTILMTPDGNHVQIPNATVFKSTITNLSSNKNARENFVIGIGYDDSIAEAQSIIGDILRRHPAVLEDPAPSVLVDSLGSSSINFRVYYWFDFTKYSRIKLSSVLMRQSLRALEAAGIEAPDDAREIVFPDGVPITKPQSAEKRVASSPVPLGNRKPQQDRASDIAHESAEEGGLASDQIELEEQANRARRIDDGTELLASPEETTR